MSSKNNPSFEQQLFKAADKLRKNIDAAEYKYVVLGLVFIKYISETFNELYEKLEADAYSDPEDRDEYLAENVFFVPQVARWSHIHNSAKLPSVGEIIDEAMEAIEKENKELKNVLPKVYGKANLDKASLGQLIDLISNTELQAENEKSKDLFGRVYEYFLGEFANAEGKKGGQFYTPKSIVKLMVEMIEPYKGRVYDPACGSGGMFVQTAHFIEDHSKGKSVNEAITVYGTELKSNNAKLAKMNLAIHGIEGKIIEGNSFYTNPHNLTGKCDFVMANPPFNVTKVDAKNKFLAEDDRLPFGVPLTGKGTISNGNYLFAQYFYSYLNETGRAGFVMASSATDAGNAEKLIRQKLIETGHVECIVSIGNNFFYTRSLPCHLWFFNKGKKAENKNKILMIDARNTYRKVTSTINDFSEEQLEGLTALINAFRGDDLGVNADNTWFNEYFPEGAYQDVEGLCKVVEMDEIIEQDYSLTPGRYVGVSIAVDMDFDYKGRMTEIHSELATLNEEANKLMNQIQSVEL